jgi:UDP-N-acetylmuramoylalanine--D-glutamate ligase
MILQNKKITIFGLSRSGFESARLLYQLRNGIKIKVTEIRDDSQIRDNVNKLGSSIDVEIGRHSENFIKDSDLIVLSPGIRTDLPILLWAKKRGIKIISEIELAYLMCPASIIAITGSNGKTTVTTLSSQILKFTGRRVHLCGNVGRPFTKEILNIKKDDLICLEVSSFQLETIDTFKPKVAVFLNFSPNHLDRYRNMKEYLLAKKKIFQNQDSKDWSVLNYEDKTLRNLSSEIKSQIVFFNNNEDEKYNKNFNSNHLATLAIGRIFGVKKEKCLEVFREFKGIEHRLEFVRDIDGIEFINDSKSTTIESAIWALKNINKPIIMIAGGKDKGGDFSSIKNLIRDKVKELIVIGEAKQKIKSAMNKDLRIKEASTLKDAVDIAYRDSLKGECILLSPMCASFDMFSDFQQRGEVFKEIVRGI